MNRCPSEWYFQKFLEEVVHDSQPVPTIAAKEEEGEHEQSTVDVLLEVLPGHHA